MLFFGNQREGTYRRWRIIGHSHGEGLARCLEILCTIDSTLIDSRSTPHTTALLRNNAGTDEAYAGVAFAYIDAWICSTRGQ